jgi:hypothetical protein
MLILAFTVMQPFDFGLGSRQMYLSGDVFAFICATLNHENAIGESLFGRVECNCDASMVSGRSPDNQHPTFMSCAAADRMVHKQYTIGFKPLFVAHGKP